MAYKTFAAIHVGFGEVSMKIYEVSEKKGIVLLDSVSKPIDLGSDTYRDAFISHEAVHELCLILRGFVLKMTEYGIKDYTAYGSNVLKEAENYNLIIDQVRLKTGLRLQVIDNAKQRYLTLKSIAYNMSNFESLISESASIADLGSGSLHLTVYDGGIMKHTQNLKLGALRVREMLSRIESHATKFNAVMDDYIGNDIDTITKIYMNGHDTENFILVSEELGPFMKIIGSKAGKEGIGRKRFTEICQEILAKTVDQLSLEYHISYEAASLLKPSCVICSKLVSGTGASKIWLADAGLCNGMAIDYLNDVMKIRKGHHFTEDLPGYARSIARRYNSSYEHTNNVEKSALIIFDSIKKLAGMNKRERLLLQLACILHDCGKYMNVQKSAYYSYQIIMAHEFLGLSEQEKKIVADVVLYNGRDAIPDRNELKSYLEDASFILMLKLAAILYVANILDRSHKQKIQDITVTVKDKEMIIRADTIYDITLEQDILESRSEFFEDIYGFEPVLRHKRR